MLSELVCATCNLTGLVQSETEDAEVEESGKLAGRSTIAVISAPLTVSSREPSYLYGYKDSARLLDGMLAG